MKSYQELENQYVQSIHHVDGFRLGYTARQEEVDELVKCIKRIGEITTCPLAQMYSENFLSSRDLLLLEHKKKKVK